MAEEKALIPIEERVVEFYGDQIKGATVMVAPLGHVTYIPITPVCEFLGVNSDAQRRRIQRDPVLSQEARTVLLQTEGGTQELFCLPLDMLNGWLFGINAARVKGGVRETLIRYQRECYRVLAQAFQKTTAADPLSQVEEMGRALITMAREQREMNRQIGETREEVGEVVARVVALEQRLTPGAVVTEEQAMQISQAAKLVAMELSAKSGRNEFGGVYGEIYRQFQITSYKLLPASRFGEAMQFLSEWWSRLTDRSIPF